MLSFAIALTLAAEPTVTKLDDGGVLIRMGGQVLPADAAGAPVLVVHDAKPIDLDVVDADIAGVLRVIGEVAKLNFVLDDDVHGTVTVRMEDVPWDQALAAILQAKGLAAVPLGANIVVVRPVGAR